MTKIFIQSIPHNEQRYRTVGDYWDDEDGIQQVRVSEMPDWRWEFLIGVHELIEKALTAHRHIDEKLISEFDIDFENRRDNGSAFGEPGDAPDSPYRREHYFATNIERLLAAELGVDWFEYEQHCDSLGAIKK